MNATHRDPNRRTGSIRLFVVLMVGGLLLLVARMLMAPGVGALDTLLPVLGGLLIALAIGLMVLRERREKRAMPPEERNRQDQGMPR